MTNELECIEMGKVDDSGETYYLMKHLGTESVFLINNKDLSNLVHNGDAIVTNLVFNRESKRLEPTNGVDELTGGIKGGFYNKYVISRQSRNVFTKKMAKLIDCERALSFKTVSSTEELDNMLKKADMMGLKYKFLIDERKSKLRALIGVEDEVQEYVAAVDNAMVAILMNKEVIVVSNKRIELESMLDEYFSLTKFTKIDLTGVYMCSDVVAEYGISAVGMFELAAASYVNLGTLDFSNVRDLTRAFRGLGNIGDGKRAKVRIIGIEDIDTGKLSKAEGTFIGIVMDSLDLTKWNFKGVFNTQEMFDGARINKLILSDIDFNNVQFATQMFEDLTCDELILSGSKFKKLKTVNSFFDRCKVHKMILSNMEFDKLNMIRYTFSQSEIDLLDITGTKLWKFVLHDPRLNSDNLQLAHIKDYVE